MSKDLDENLLNPGDTPHDNAQFLVYCVAVIRAVARYPELLRVTVASAANDHQYDPIAGIMLDSVSYVEIECGILVDIKRSQLCKLNIKCNQEMRVPKLNTINSQVGDRNVFELYLAIHDDRVTEHESTADDMDSQNNRR